MTSGHRSTHDTQPLSGLRVVDLSDRLSGAFAAFLFADFGADVVQAEAITAQGLRGPLAGVSGTI